MKLGQSVAEASVSSLPPAGYHTYEVVECEYKEFDSGAAGFQFKFRLTASDNVPEAVNRTMFFLVVTQKKDGGVNEIGAGDLKKIIAAAVSKESSEDPNFDTDDLVGTSFAAQLSVVTKDGNENARLSRHAAV